MIGVLQGVYLLGVIIVAMTCFIHPLKSVDHRLRRHSDQVVDIVTTLIVIMWPILIPGIISSFFPGLWRKRK